ncbi:MAG: ABC transporter ATP-binding protein [Chryseolinea sp.]
MNIYLRILQYTPNAKAQFLKFLIFSTASALFQAVYLGLLQPLIELMFLQKIDSAVPQRPEFSLSIGFFKKWFQYYLSQSFEAKGAASTLLLVCSLIIVFVLLSNTMRYLERLIASKVKVDVVKNIRIDLFNKVTQLHIGYFSDQRKGDLISRFTNDVSEVENTVLNLFRAIREPMMLIILITALLVISVKLTLITMVILPITGAMIASIIKKLKVKATQSQEAMGRIVSILDETFSGMRVIKAFNARAFIGNKLETEAAYHRKVNFSMSRRNELASPLSEFLGITIVAGILFYGGLSVISGDSELSPAAFFTFLTIYANMIQPAKNLSNGLASLQKGVISAGRIFSVIDTPSAIRNKPNAIALDEFKNSIEFKDVTFAYDKDPVLKNINLRIEKGKTVALVGPSGGGKSTLADLIPRFYDPSSGTVMLDGVALPEYDLESLRKQVGVVTQESILFNDTIFNNIAFGMPNISEEDVIRAAKVANAHEFIMQSELGYQTMIGERGSKLSGGQRQRLSIARAVLKNPPILILDEATSALDSESEKLVQDALTKLMQNRTSVVIAHRLSTIQHADEIVVIQQGQIIERGKHTELLHQDGLYKKLIQIQKL